jgi:hypothetical protein
MTKQKEPEQDVKSFEDLRQEVIGAGLWESAT